MSSETLLPDETRKYLQAHPRTADQLQNAERIYKIFGNYLNLTQSRVIIRESGASNTEADLSATILRTDS